MERPLSAALLPEFDHEMANTRRVLERVPEEKLSWRPHPKSFTMAALASHVANLPSWTNITLGSESLDLASPEATTPRTPVSSQQELLALFDGNVTAARSALADASNEQLVVPWTLHKADQVIMTLPRIAVLRNMVMNHIIHHRAQLTVYLRLNDVAVPSIYGPSADEGGF